MTKLVETTTHEIKIDWQCPNCFKGIMVDVGYIDIIEGKVHQCYRCNTCNEMEKNMTKYPIIKRDVDKKIFKY